MICFKEIRDKGLNALLGRIKRYELKTHIICISIYYFYPYNIKVLYINFK